MYGIRVKGKDGRWKRYKTLRNRKGVWKRSGALFTLKRLRARGKKAHMFELVPAVQYPTATHYSKNFARTELNCKCGCKPSPLVERNLTELAEGLETVRAELGHGIAVLSGHRCTKRNDAVGGARNSRHILGEAADLLVPGGKQNEFVQAAMTVGIFRDGGIGIYPNGGVHVDHRPWVARWNSWSR